MYLSKQVKVFEFWHFLIIRISVFIFDSITVKIIKYKSSGIKLSISSSTLVDSWKCEVLGT